MAPRVGPIYTALGDWHPWFAWYPVAVAPKGWAWMSTVYRRRYIDNVYRHPFWVRSRDIPKD